MRQIISQKKDEVMHNKFNMAFSSTSIDPLADKLLGYKTDEAVLTLKKLHVLVDFQEQRINR